MSPSGDGPDDAAREAVRRGYRGYRDWMARYAAWPELDIWYDNVDMDQLSGYVAPDDEHRLERYIEKRAGKRSQRGSVRKFTQLVDGTRQLTEAPPYRTHALSEYEERLDGIIRQYRASIPDHVSHLWSRFDLIDAVQQVAGHPVAGSLAQDPSVGRCELEGSPVGSVPGPLQELADEVLLTAVEVAA